MGSMKPRDIQMPPTAAKEAKIALQRAFKTLDWLILAVGALLLVWLVVTSAQANISADAVDYYAILQRLTPSDETPIVRNLPFLDQRSPGYGLVALVPYLLISATVDPLVETDGVVDAASTQDPAPAEAPARRTGPPPVSSNDARGSEFVRIPASPLLLRDVLFKEFYIPAEGSQYQWTLVLALAATSYLFLFLGIAANAWTLRWMFPAVSGVSLAVLAVFGSAVFMHNVLATPLYATLMAYGLASIFALFFLRACKAQKPWLLLPAGFFLGFMVLTRLELAVLAATVALCLMLYRGWIAAVTLTLGATPALLVWLVYNATQFGTPVYLGILGGDINRLAFDLDYIVNNLFHPASGVLWWSPLLIPGLAGLLLSRSGPLRILGIGSVALLALYLFRVPVMYQQSGESFIQIGGIAVTVPDSPAAMRELVRSDINRYVTVLLPFAVLGLRDLLGRIWSWVRSRVARRKGPKRRHASV